MKKNKVTGGWLIISAMLLFLLACSSGDDGVEGSGLDISGTAAVGSAISNASLTIKSLGGVKAGTTTNANGKFSISVSGDGPALLKVDVAAGQSLYSIANASGTTNIHPFTDLIIRNWFEGQALDIDAEFANNNAISKLPSTTEVNAIKVSIKSLLNQALSEFNLSNEIDLISSAFDANNTGFDRFLDFSQVVIINNNITIALTDPVTQVDNEIVTDVGLDTDFSAADTQSPSTPNKLRAFPVSESEIIVVWEPATDNIGVAGYNIYRNGSLVVTTPYPVFSDAELSANTAYCYEVEAIDGAGNISTARASISENCPETTNTVDNTPPAVPTQLQAVVQSSAYINLTWLHENIDDVVSFNIYRGEGGNSATRIATVAGTSLNDFSAASSTAYCYQITALDAAGNESERSIESCTTTDSDNTPKPSGDSSLSFSVASQQVTEAEAIATLTVNRTGDSSAAISVDYSTEDGTATEELDYNPTSGTLTWGADDNSPRTIQVVIKPDGQADDNETFTVSLSNFSANALAGNITATTVTITDAVCPGSLSENIQQSTTISECTIVDGNILVSNGTLTINPGVTLIFTSASGIQVSSEGVLYAKGTEEQPILFTGEQATPGYWKGIEFRESNNVDNLLDFVTIEYGGDSIDDANLHMKDFGKVNRVRISNSTFRSSLGYGFIFDDTTVLDNFTNNVSTGNAQGPAYLPANIVGKLTSDSDFAGNTNDIIFIEDWGVTIDQTWASLNVPYSVGNQRIDANLSIEAGATLIFRSGGYLEVHSTGSLSAIGTVENPILFTSEQPTAGYWSGVEFRESNNALNTLAFVTIEYGGASENDANLHMRDFGNANRIQISNSTFRSSLGYGFIFDDTTVLDNFTNNVSTGNAQGPAYLPANIVGKLTSDSDFSGNTNDIIFIEDWGVTIDQSWASLNVPYSVGKQRVDANLSIEAGTTLIFRSGGYLEVRSTGSLSAIGTAEKPILLTSDQPTAGYWNGVEFRESDNIKNQLDYVTIEYGGASDSDANLHMRDFGNANRIQINNSTFRNGLGYGIIFDDKSLIDVFNNVTSTGNTLGPVKMPANLVGKLSSNSDYTGNEIDAVFVSSDGISTDQTWLSINVPYSTGRHNIGANLTIEPGTTLEFRADGWWNIQSTGSMSAIGTAEQPIIFTAEQSSPGYWDGIAFRESNSAGNVLDYVTVEYGGNGLPEGANLEFVEFGNPSGATITNSTFQHSSGWGIILDSDTLVNDDLATSNQFDNNPSGSIFRP